MTKSFFFKDQSKAEDLKQILDDKSIISEIQCACIKDHGQEECEDFMSSCRAGVYLEIE